MIIGTSSLVEGQMRYSQTQIASARIAADEHARYAEVLDAVANGNEIPQPKPASQPMHSGDRILEFV